MDHATQPSGSVGYTVRNRAAARPGISTAVKKELKFLAILLEQICLYPTLVINPNVNIQEIDRYVLKS